MVSVRHDDGPSTVSAAAVPIASIAANVASYALLLAAAHVMGESDYGKLSSLLGLLLVSTVPMLALQTVAARRTAIGDALLGLVRGTTVVALGATAVLAALSPALTVFLHLHSPLGVLLVAATVPATGVLGTAMGVSQGRRNFHRLALLICLSTGGRSIGGLVGLGVHHSTDATLVGVVVGTSAAAVGAVLVGGGAARHRVALRDRERHGVVVEALQAAQAHGAFLLLTSLDVLLARHVLSSSAAGVYGVGSVITRAAVWLPQSVVLLMFASLAEQDRHRATARRAVLVVGGIGVSVTVGTALLGRLVVTVVGGSKYHSLDHAAWRFALLGALLALVQLAVMAGLARRRARRTLLVWVTIAADLVVVLAASGTWSPTRLVTTLLVVTAAGAAVAIAVTLRGAGAGDVAGVGSPDSATPGTTPA